MQVIQKDFSTMTDAALLSEYKKYKDSKIFYAFVIGFLAAILVFGVVAWVMSDTKNFGFFIPMLIPIIMIKNLLKRTHTHQALEKALKDRNLV